MCECAICLDTINNGFTLSCGHQFHNSCITNWLLKNETCPTCRKDICPCSPVTKKIDNPVEQIYVMIDKTKHTTRNSINTIKEHSLEEITLYLDNYTREDWVTVNDKYDVIDIKVTKKNNRRGRYKSKEIICYSIYINKNITHIMVFNIHITKHITTYNSFIKPKKQKNNYVFKKKKNYKRVKY